MTTTDGTGANKAKAKVSPARNVVGLVLLVVFGTTAIVETMANRGFNAAATALKKRLPEETSDSNAVVAELPTKEEAEKILGKSPDGPLVKEDGMRKATYTWRGVIRKHVITAFYTDEAKPKLNKFATE
ncbi:MAG: hypothetical protein JWN86_1013 [Planctomycetota bacterium]|nr:hypothetical protein [Planctomycetota bacterium]